MATTELLNMVTGDLLSFTCDPKVALRTAFELSRRRSSAILPGLQPPLESYPFVETDRTLALGDFCYLKEGGAA